MFNRKTIAFEICFNFIHQAAQKLLTIQINEGRL